MNWEGVIALSLHSCHFLGQGHSSDPEQRFVRCDALLSLKASQAVESQTETGRKRQMHELGPHCLPM